MQRRSSKSGKGGKKLPTAYSKADAFGGSKYEVSHIVGKGAYGVVWAGRCRTKDNKKVAIKHIDRVFEVREDALRIVRELRFLRLLKHANVVAVEDVLLPRNRKSYNDIHIVFELFDTDLNHMIRSETRYDMTHRRWVLYQILQGVAHMHSAEVFHRDLKPGNILINANCDCKICDFGMARARKPDDEEETVALWTDYVASRWYRAPELICCYLTRYTAAIDVWSIGCIASELLVRKALFPGKNGEQQLDLITDLVGAPSREDLQSLRSSRVKELLRTMRTKRPTDFRSFFPREADDSELSLIREMLTFSADKRISAAASVEHQYFDAIRDLPGAQIPYTETPRLDKTEFVFEEAKTMTKEMLREVLYQEIEHYHPDLRAEWETARVVDETVDDGGEDGESSAGTEGDETKCWRRRPRLDSKGNARKSGGSGSDVEEVFEVEDDTQPEPAPQIAVPPTGDVVTEDPV